MTFRWTEEHEKILKKEAQELEWIRDDPDSEDVTKSWMFYKKRDEYEKNYNHAVDYQGLRERHLWLSLLIILDETHRPFQEWLYDPWS